jgi:transposase-like protein
VCPRANAGREGTPVLTVVTYDEPTPAGTTTAAEEPSTIGGSLIDEIVREGARRMLAAALEAEVAAYIAAHADQLDERGRRLVVRNGRAEPRQVLTSAGAVEVVAPRVNDKRTDEATGERRRFTSAILPAWCRKSPKINEVLPLLYLHGLSSQDFVPALEGFLGTGSGLSAATVTRLTAQWQDEAKAFHQRDLSTVDYVYLWADGIHLGVRLEEEKLCLLVMIGVRVDGTKELIALIEGYRESTGSWADLLRDCKRRGMRAPVLAVGDGALGFWAALREVFPDTREQRCWFHKIGNVLSALPRSAHPGAKRALAEIWNAEDREHARRAVAAFKLAYGAKFGKAVAKITDDLNELLAFYDYPAEHWVHLRTTNPIESTFATVRHRTKVTKGPGSKAAGLAMAFKLIEAAQARWRAVNAPHLVALVRAGARFERGHLVERPTQPTATTAAAA